MKARQTTARNTPDDAANRPTIRIGVSSCLLGERVRYDGNDKRDAYVTGTLSRYFDLVPVCPEVAVGLGVPRPPIRLVGDVKSPRALGVHDPALDPTDALRAFGRTMATELSAISGYLFKSRSPSCGMEGVPVYPTVGSRRARKGVGLYAREIMNAHPLLPVEEEGRLADAGLRDNFLERVFALRRWQETMLADPSPEGLAAFHRAHRLSLMAHGRGPLGALDDALARIGDTDIRQLAGEYFSVFMTALKCRATPHRHIRVLRHLLARLRPYLDGDDKEELLMLIEAYRCGRLPRIMLLVLFGHHFRRHPDPAIVQSVYLYPGPEELTLRSAL